MAPFLYPIVYAIISLFIAFILFKYLKSSASFKDKTTGYQAGGAIAGFIIVFSILFGSYVKLNGSLNDYKSFVQKNERVPYTIFGKVKKLDNANNDGVTITLYPPASKGISDRTGRFTIEGIRLSQVDIDSLEVLSLAVDVDGYAVNTLELPKGKFHIREYDKQISIDTIITLTPINIKAVQPLMEIVPDSE
jgi:hypothetical protein